MAVNSDLRLRPLSEEQKPVPHNPFLRENQKDVFQTSLASNELLKTTRSLFKC